jgi:hypothetical protein
MAVTCVPVAINGKESTMTAKSAQLSRRQALRHFAGGAVAATVGVCSIAATEAARRWCLADPVLRIAGQSVHVYIGSTLEMLESATDKIRLTVTLPLGVRGRLSDIAADFGEGYDVRFSSSSTLVATGSHVPMLVNVYCPARDSTLPVTVDVAPVGTGAVSAATGSGTANTWIKVRAG